MLRNYRHTHLTALLSVSLTLVGLVIMGSPQVRAEGEEKLKAAKTAAPAGKEFGKEVAGEAAESGPRLVQTKSRDPFVVPSRVKREPKVVVKKEPQPIAPPSLEERLQAYRGSVRAAASVGQSVPDKLSPYLIEELNITGIYRNGDGYGAFVAASPTRLTFFARTGMKTHDGVVKEVTPTGIKFVKTVRFDNGSTRQTEEFRPLRPAKSEK